MKVINKTLRDKEVNEFLKEYETDFLIDLYMTITEELAKRGIEIHQEYIKKN